MANKFQRSVQERMQKEAQRNPQGTDVKKEEPPSVQEPETHFSVKTKFAALPPTMPSPPEVDMTIRATTVSPTAPGDISGYLSPEKSRAAKNKTFYLDVEVIEALHSAANQAKVTDSRLCNDILRTVLGLNR